MPVSNMGSNGKGKPFFTKKKKLEKKELKLEDRRIRDKTRALAMEKR